MKKIKVIVVELTLIVFFVLPFFVVPAFSSVDARGQEALLRFGQFSLIDDEKKWQEILLTTNCGRNIQNVFELNNILGQANPHSSAIHFSKTTTLEELNKSIRLQNLPVMVNQENFTVIQVPGIYTFDVDYNEQYTTKLFEFILNSQSNVVLDLRDNFGGDYIPMIIGASLLIPDGKILDVLDKRGDHYPLFLTGSQLSGGANNLLATSPYPKDMAKAVREISEDKLLNKKVAVLVNDGTASAAEFLILALKNNPNVKTFGLQSAGFTSWNAGFYLDRMYDSEVWSVTATDGYLKGTFGKKEVFRNAPIPPDFPMSRTFRNSTGELDDYTKNEIQKFLN